MKAKLYSWFDRLPLGLKTKIFAKKDDLMIWMNPWLHRFLLSRQDIEYWESMRGRYSEQPIFLVGSGPSLSVADLDCLVDKVSFACNRIYLAFPDTSWRPTYYYIEDSLMCPEISELNSVFSELEIVAPQSLITRIAHREHLSLHAVNLLREHGWRSKSGLGPSFASNPIQGIYSGSTAVFGMLQLACYLGAKTIVLIGVDFNYTPLSGVSEGDQELIADGKTNNHFRPDYVPKGVLAHPPNKKRQYKAFQSAQAYCEGKGVHIYNASRETQLDVFPKAELEAFL